MDTIDPLSQPDRPPVVPGYDAVRCLGTGAQGSVWLMNAHNGSAPVAAKFLATSVPGGSADTKPVVARHNESQITHEWRVMAQFRHEHLIAVHRIVQDDTGGQVLIMDYAAGGSLHQVIHSRGALTVGETVTALTPMGQVLAFLHERGTVHGDLSPGNILLSAAGKPYLADFGFGRLLGQAPATPAGTPGFYCPQDATRDEAADVYALAAIGWFALTGTIAPPTRERLPLGTFVDDVPAELVAALEAGLNDNPALRPTAGAFAQAVFRSAPAEALALGSAVHPSVLPQLPTRRVASVRRRGRRRHLRPRQAPRRRYAWRQWRLPGGCAAPRSMRLSHLWASGPRPAGRSGIRGVVPALIAATIILAGLVLVAGMAFGGSWGALAPGGTGQGSAYVPTGMRPVEADMDWAAGLPTEIQRGLTSVEPVAALHALAWVRAHALSNADQALIDMVNAPESAALGADSTIVQELTARGHTLTGLTVNVSQASTTDSRAAPNTDPAGTRLGGAALPGAGGTVRVQASITTSAFAEQDRAGALVHRQSEEQSQELDIVMASIGARWRILQILAPGTP